MKKIPDHIMVSEKIVATPVFVGCEGQDGAIFGDMLFRFNTRGGCVVYSLEKRQTIAEFTLDKADVLAPHSNAVCFGTERIMPDDEFPLLYTNIYNNYAAAADRLEGVCCVYRIFREGDGFSSKLIQVIRIGFTDDMQLWCSLPDAGDVRPYGNIVVDVFTGRLYAFTMRDAEKTTRYFEFRMPGAGEGVYSSEWGVNVVTLEKNDIISMFDCEYSNYIQGACAYGGMLFSLEGFTVHEPDHPRRPRIQIIDMANKKQLAAVELCKFDLFVEPELIDFADDILYYMDASGAVYTFEFV